MAAPALSPEQAALARQAARLASLGGFVIDPAGERCLWCSEEVARIHGIPVADCAVLLISAERLERWVHADDRERYRQLRAEGRHNGSAYTIEYRLHNADGELRWLYETGEHLREADGGERLIGSIRDMTAPRHAEAALQRANEMLERRIAQRTAELPAAKEAAESAGREAKASHERFLAAAGSLMDGLAIYDQDDRLGCVFKLMAPGNGITRVRRVLPWPR